VLLRCPTLRSVLTEVDQYVTLVAPACGFRLEERPGTSLLHFSTTFPDPAITRVVTEMAMSFVLRIARHHISAVVRPSGIAFAFPEPAHAHVYREVFDCPVRFGAETTAIYFDTHLLDETQPFADEALRGLLKVRADELLKQARDSRGLANRVRYALEREPDLSNVSMARMAKRIGMSPSELRRRLREEHTSWTHALAEARREMALRKLRNPEIPIKQIADETGFSEPSAFHRAFRRWTGSTPARFRAEALHERGLRNSA
jgi:AraC-like DNA-binding protein